MKSRDTKRQQDKVAERTSGQSGPFPYHRLGKKQKAEQKQQASYQEEQSRTSQAKEKRNL